MNIVTKGLIVAGITMALGACGTNTTTPINVGLGAPAIPKATPITTSPVKWKVHNRETLRKLMSDLEGKPSGDYSVFVLTPDGYKALSLNLLEMERYIREQREIIVYLTKTLQGRDPANQAPTKQKR